MTDKQEILQQARAKRDELRQRLVGTKAKRQRVRTVFTIGVVGLILLTMAVTAFAISGPLPGFLFIASALFGVSLIPIGVTMLRDGMPFSTTIARGLAIVAQIAFNKAALIRRADGRYEWTALKDDSNEYYATLENGERVDIDAEAGDLYKFGLGKLAIVEQRGESMTEFRADSVEGSERAGFDVEPATPQGGGIPISLTAIARRVRGSASSTLVRRGRDKALDEEGGTGQISELWTMAFATILLIVGFAMTFGALSL
jgi:hypothetical protein